MQFIHIYISNSENLILNHICLVESMTVAKAFAMILTMPLDMTLTIPFALSLVLDILDIIFDYKLNMTLLLLLTVP